jgi:hypothetical protein
MQHVGPMRGHVGMTQEPYARRSHKRALGKYIHWKASLLLTLGSLTQRCHVHDHAEVTQVCGVLHSSKNLLCVLIQVRKTTS